MKCPKCPKCGSALLLLNPFRYDERNSDSTSQYRWCFRCNKQFTKEELAMEDRDLEVEDRGLVTVGELEDDHEAWKKARNRAVGVTDSQKRIAEVCDDLKDLLLEKNRKYGDSALNPIRVFSKADAREQILIRIDDKLNRIKNRQNDEDEDVIKDLAGYLILLLASWR